MAAAQNHSEALFCLGALYENGQGGVSRNRTKALELFRLSASQKTPWPAALQALGSYHWNNGPAVSHRCCLEESNGTVERTK
jgi:TPR repeat protein